MFPQHLFHVEHSSCEFEDVPRETFERNIENVSVQSENVATIRPSPIVSTIVAILNENAGSERRTRRFLPQVNQ
jgi:hypothetical protein